MILRVQHTPSQNHPPSSSSDDLEPKPRILIDLYYPFTQQYYTPHKSKKFTPLLDEEPPPKNISLSTITYLSCIPLTSGNDPYPYSYYPPLQIPPVLLPIIINNEILLPLYAWVGLFHFLFLCNIC